jgi:cell division protein FtsW
LKIVGRRAVIACLLVAPAAALGAIGLALVATAAASGHPAAPGLGSPRHFAIRQVVALASGGLLAVAVIRLGPRRLFRAAPALFLLALATTAAVFLPGVGVRSGGASRWLHAGPLSGNPAPFLIGAAGLLVAASRAGDRPTGILTRPTAVVALTLVAILVLVAEPDFSSAATALAVAVAALAGGGVASRRLAPAALLLLLALGLGASRFGYVGGRVHGFLAPERDRRGKGFEVLQLARLNATLTNRGTGLGKGTARRHLSSPASDYALAVVSDELGRGGALAVVVAWVAIGAGAALAARAARREPDFRAAALGATAALFTPAALHLAVCRGVVPIVGVSMPFLSYDPALTVASGAEIGLLVAVALGAAPDRRGLAGAGETEGRA